MTLKPGYLECPDCNGDGTVTCGTCGGSWEDARDCECRDCGNTHSTTCDCGEEGSNECANCSGDGQIEDPDYVLAEGI